MCACGKTINGEGERRNKNNLNQKKGRAFMANIGLVRIDDRLIHGQIVTSWLQASRSNRIIVIDDGLAKDPFLSQVFALAAPPGIPVETKSCEQAVTEWKENEFGKGTALILFKSVPQLRSAFEKGFRFKTAQIGGLGSKPGRKLINRTISLSKEEAQDLKALADDGAEIICQMLPEDSIIHFNTVLKKHFADLLELDKLI
jgi:D-glucosaminate-specific PTS system IIB component